MWLLRPDTVQYQIPKEVQQCDGVEHAANTLLLYLPYDRHPEDEKAVLLLIL